MPAKQLQPTQTSTKTPDTGGPTAAPERQPGGNEALQGQVKEKVAGPIGRVWNHILGQPESADTSAAFVDQAMVRAYLEKRVGFAEGEMFRGKKLDGASESLVKQYDKDGDMKLSWPEFKNFEESLFAMLAPDAAAGKEKTGPAAAKGFGEADTSGDGAANLEEIQASTKKKLPKGTKHEDLVAQLGARVAIDAVDRDESSKPISERSVSKGEWSKAAEEMGGSRGK